MTNTLRAALRRGWLIAISAGCFLGMPGVGGAEIRPFKAGEILISVNRGAARSQVDQIAASINATVVQAWGPLDYERRRDTYHLRITGGQNVPDATTLSA